MRPQLGRPQFVPKTSIRSYYYSPRNPHYRSPSAPNFSPINTMSLVNLAHVCSHLQNASKARLGLTSIPLTNLHLRLCLGLQKQGFFSSVQVAGMKPPVEEIPSPEQRESLAKSIESEPWQAYAAESRSEDGPSDPELGLTISPDLPRNQARRRIWLGLKYFENHPVLSEMHLVSKPTRRIWMHSHELADLVRGKRKGYVQGLTRPGECMFVSTDRGIWEARECVEGRIGGMLLCRVI